MILLDLGLPDIAGVDVTAAPGPGRPPHRRPPARTGGMAGVQALDAARTTTSTKPFSMDEPLARLRAATGARRAPSGTVR